MADSVLIVGAGGHAHVIWDLLSQGSYEVVGFTDLNAVPGESKRLGDVTCPVLGDDTAIAEQTRVDQELRLFSGVGPEPAEIRRKITDLVLSFGPARMFVAVHPRAVVASSAQVGLDTAIMAGAVINPKVKIGRHCVINTGATVDHDCRLGDNVFVQPGANLAGGIDVGDGTVVGIGASIREDVKIGRNAFIGGGAFVNNDVPDGSVYVGVPARFLKDRSTQ